MKKKIVWYLKTVWSVHITNVMLQSKKYSAFVTFLKKGFWILLLNETDEGMLFLSMRELQIMICLFCV